MQHEEHISQLIVRSLLGTLDDQGRQELDAWLAADPRHRQLLEELSCSITLDQHIAELQRIDCRKAQAMMEQRIKEAEARQQESAQPLSRRLTLMHNYWLIGIAAMLLLIVGTYYYIDKVTIGHRPVATRTESRPAVITHGTTQALLRLSDGKVIRLGADQQANRRAIAKACGRNYHGNIVVTTPRGGEYRLTLTDGTEISLNAGSRLEYPAVFDGKERRVKAEGEAFFKVAHDKEHPFYVETGGQELRVVGTEFNINSYTPGIVVTTLIHGIVTIHPRGAKGGVLTLHPGEQAEYSDKSGTAQIRQANTEVVGSWTTGSFVFENQTLEQIMEELSRWYDFDYTFRNATPRQTVFMGSVPRYGDFKNVLHILEMSGGIHFQVKGKHVYIF